MLGTPAGQLARVLRVAHPLLLRRVTMDDAFLHRALDEHRRLVVVLTHGGPISFLPVVAALLRSTAERDPERRMIGTFHPAWWKIPGLRMLPRMLSSSQRHASLPELQEALTTQEQLDYLALPESENCVYGEPGEVKPFRMHGFIELSIRARAPMLLVAHKGSEHWYRRIDFSGRLFSVLERLPPRVYNWVEFNKEIVLEEVRERRTLNLPLPVGRAALDVKMALHHPQEFESGLAEEWKPRRRQVLAEGERIRAKLQSLYDALP